MHSLATSLSLRVVVASSLRIVVSSSLGVVVSLLGTATSLLRILSASSAAHSWRLMLVVLVLPSLELRESKGSSVNCTTLYSGILTYYFYRYWVWYCCCRHYYTFSAYIFSVSLFNCLWIFNK